MRIVRGVLRDLRKTPGVAQVSRHAEVDQENATALEPKNQIFAATLDGSHPLALQLGRHLGRLVGAHEPRVLDLDTLEAAPRQHRLESRADRLDLGQLGHTANLAVALGPYAGGGSS